MNTLCEIHFTADQITIIGSVIAFIVIFILLRDFFAWWNKMSDVIKLLKRNNELLEKLTGEKQEENAIE